MTEAGSQVSGLGETMGSTAIAATGGHCVDPEEREELRLAEGSGKALRGPRYLGLGPAEMGKSTPGDRQVRRWGALWGR